ncbi:hypothetical protein Sjap_001457 [Stephania japonica]|uniref:Thioredoxin domain-containing protein n=1 Tax=Stephania japonica TaxID=461633 RepID=A0AAP0KMA5_9MAGN
MASSIVSRDSFLRLIRRNLSTAISRHHPRPSPSPSLPEPSLLLRLSQTPHNTVVCHRNLVISSPPFRLFSSSAVPESVRDSELKSSENGGHKDGGSSSAGKSARGAPVSWLSFLLVITTGAGLIYYYEKEKKRHIEEINNASTAVKQGPSVGKAAIGGPFNLVNDEGKPVTEKDFLGKWTLIYFGFTHCPDICPDELIKLAAAIDKIKEKSGFEVVPVFISVDPERDTVEQVHDYVKEFHPRLIGLTGAAEEIKKVARAYRVYYMKTEEEGSDYLVDHSIIMYLMGPDMEFVKFYGKNNEVDALTEGVIKEIKQYRK